ncbi:unnamed protein product [Caenorhabditis bovis]|uniref:Tyrosine-protein kinase n=1 Tax=Caenorhabditis bovis TaxID=2654633 RepID=A0A8S1F3I0_9PELO|nr:unnamed protein product [Caenorhabditis bovis]
MKTRSPSAPSAVGQAPSSLSGVKKRMSMRKLATGPGDQSLLKTQTETSVVHTEGVNPKQDIVKTLAKCLIEHTWFHGVMPRDEISELLQKDGDFIVRKTTEKGKPIICLSVRHGPEVRHFPLSYENGIWFLKNMDKNRKFFDLDELLNYLVTERFPLPPSNAVLIQAIPRPEYYILHDNITLTKKLGSGAFGEVWKGKLKKVVGPGDVVEIEVAVKKMKGNPTKAVTAEFVKEAKLMRKLVHRNIVTVHGVAPSEEPLMIIIELASNGCLKEYVKKHKCPTDQLMQFAADAARGMAYLSSKLIIHRDLAARNLLLGAQVEVKIADFGLSVAGKNEIKVNKMKLPIRWLAPETIDTGVFTAKTDVWSYSVTLWEIFNRCASDPFPNMTNQQAKEKIRTLTPPMQAPPEAPMAVVRLMLDCFEKTPEARPTFAQILKRLCPNEDVSEYEKNPDEAKTQYGDVPDESTKQVRLTVSNRVIAPKKSGSVGQMLKPSPSGGPSVLSPSTAASSTTLVKTAQPKAPAESKRKSIMPKKKKK